MLDPDIQERVYEIRMVRGSYYDRRDRYDGEDGERAILVKICSVGGG